MQNQDMRQKLREIRRLCGLKELGVNELAYWVDTDAARDPQSSLRTRIKNELGDAKDVGEEVSLLIYGHGGSGKSTELTKLTQEIGDEFFIVRFSALKELDLLSLTAADLLVVVAEQVLAKADEKSLPVDVARMSEIYGWFAQETTTTTEERNSALQVGAEASVGSSLLSPIVKLMASLKGEIKFSSSTSSQKTLHFRQSPGALVKHVNDLIDEVRVATPVGQTMLIIIEDLDKLDIGTARKVFIEDINLLTSVDATIIYTIPIFTFHSPDAATLRTKFGECLSLPMIKVMESDGQTRVVGFDTVKDVIRRRIPEEWLDQEAAELLIEKTGGVLQHVFEVINLAASMNMATVPLQKTHIEYGLSRKMREFYNEITIPFGGIPGHDDLTVDDLYERLAKCAREQLQGKSNPPVTDPINQVLLRCCALVEYNGRSWHCVHPLVMDILRELGRI